MRKAQLATLCLVLLGVTAAGKLILQATGSNSVF